MKTQTKIVLILVLMTFVGNVSADFVVQTSDLLLGEAGYITNTPGSSVSFGTSGITLNSLILDKPSAQVAPPSDGSTITSFFDLWTEVSLTGAINGTCGHHHHSHISWSPTSGANIQPRLFNSEILALDISGPGFLLRESPTFASTGRHTIANIGGGFFAIESYFDIFLEISTDGGANWSPSSTSLPITSVTPEPASLLLLGLGSLLIKKRK
ncbi:MAG: PEP-CTERM sorting domain-containing protein [Planctomycetes bacterium]|nr:PEP-CTERM sorting domain-containing protein [Planctomycetota bacterium]